MGAIGLGVSAPFLEHMMATERIIIIPPDPPVIEINTLSITLPVPDNTQEGDMLMALISTDDAPVITHPVGWDLEDSIGGTAKSFAYLRLSPGGEPASYTWNLSGAQDAIGSIIRFVNVDPDDPIHVKNSTSGNGSTVSVPAITTTLRNTMLITLISLNDGVLLSVADLDNNNQVGLWLVNSSGQAIGSVGSSASYRTLRKDKTYSGYGIDTQGLIVTDYYVLQMALAPDQTVLFRLTDTTGNLLKDSDGNKLFSE